MKDQKKKKNLKESFWPDTSTPAGRKKAIGLGAGAAGWMAGSYAFMIALFFFTKTDIFTREKIVNEAEIIGIQVGNSFGLLLGILFCFLIYKKESRIAASITLAWVLFEIVMKTIAYPGKGLIVSIFITIFALNGIRGTFSKKPPPEFKDQSSGTPLGKDSGIIYDEPGVDKLRKQA